MNKKKDAATESREMKIQQLRIKHAIKNNEQMM